jgi:two-component system chemotaxis response regulator CheY
MQSILAVDDSPSMRKMVSFTLTGAGYHVVEAVDGQDALEKAETHDIHLVLADQNMPRLDGIGLTRKLREHPRFKTSPILILTTESSDQMKQAGRSAGATGWLVKPKKDPGQWRTPTKKAREQARTSTSVSSIRSSSRKRARTWTRWSRCCWSWT